VGERSALLSAPSIGRTRGRSCRIVLHCRQILTEMGDTNALGFIVACFAREPRTNGGTRGPVQRSRCAVRADGGVTMTEHAVVIAGGGPTGLMLAAELALGQVDVAIVERRENQDLASVSAGGLHARTIEISTNAASPIASCCRGRPVRLQASRSSLSTSATSRHATITCWRSGRSRSSASWLIGSASWR